MPVVAVAPNDDLLAKLQSNLEEVRAREESFMCLVILMHIMMMNP
ncbi:MAG: hypothetical protein CM15mP86_17080 [Gammaproteobacteria bacterium]|nr:MAG: hypothetical protein CM15mP86_17080 [Gammaproteobacteria bacterium]